MKKLAAVSVLSAVLLTGCAGPSSTSAPAATAGGTATSTQSATATKTATPKASPTPTPEPVKTTGDYGNDLAAAGTVPENVELFRTVMAQGLCESSLSQASAVGSFTYGVKRFGMPGSESSGSSPSVVRLTVAYFCPERAAAAETKLKELGYTN